jgi:DNA-nicking Smr family endonuclease
MADREPSGEDDALWRAVTSEVKPLRSRKPHSKTAPAQLEPSGIPAPENSDPVISPPQAAASFTPPEQKRAPPPSPALSLDASPGVDKRTAERLKRGQLPIEARIDLHGLTQREAHQTLTNFLEGARETHRRTVLVITGKGESGQGVLREAVPRWLNEASIRPLILAFSQAQPRDGGTGALYVLLRRMR